MKAIILKNRLVSVLRGLQRRAKKGWHFLYKGNGRLLKKKPGLQEKPEFTGGNRRRELIKGLAGIPFLALFSGAFAKTRMETVATGVSDIAKKFDSGHIKAIEGKLPEGKLGKLTVSRMIMGCNLIGGWSHARDLIYTDMLFKTYHSENKIIETLYLAEQAGINTTMMVTQFYPVFNKYKERHNVKIQSICQAMLPQNDFLSDVNLAINSGATALYIQGGEGDKYISSGKFDMVFKAIDHIKKQGFPAGMGAHSLETIKACEKEGIPVDFYVKTLHQDRYWSAHPEANREEYSIIGRNSSDHNKFHDNMWDLFPSRTIEFMKTVNKPWIAFKVLAAGAIHPKEGFRHAFENGADFIAVGMFDFQIADDVNMANQILASLGKRDRVWYS